MTAVVHTAGPFPDEAPFTRHCTGCGRIWPCPEQMATIEPVPAPPRRSLEPGERAILAKVAMWWHVEGHEGLQFYAHRGGTVVGYHDGDDGRIFRVLCWHKRRPHLVEIAQADLEPAGCHEPDTSVLRGHAMELCRCATEHPDRHGMDKLRCMWLQLAAAAMERAAA